MVQFKFNTQDGTPYYYDKSRDPFFMDFHVKSEEIKCDEPLIVEGLRYMNLTCFTKDIATTLVERNGKLENYKNELLRRKKLMNQKFLILTF